jgi:DNA-binding response OmpR family regulator
LSNLLGVGMDFKINKIASQNIPLPVDPVLVIDDEYMVVEVVNHYLKDMGLNVVGFTDPLEALASLKKNKYCLYIVDQRMPQMDGVTFIQEIQAFDANPVIIVVTGSENNELVVETMRLGIFDYYFKPLHPENFKNKVKRAIEYAYYRNFENSIKQSTTSDMSKLLEWLIFKNRNEDKKANELHINSVENLITFLNADWGLGALIKNIREIKANLNESEEGFYKVSKETLDQIFVVNEEIENLTDGLSYVNFAIGEKLNLVDWESESVDGLIDSLIENLTTYTSAKNVKILFTPTTKKAKLELEMDVLIMAIEELVINACKYSISNSIIHVYSTLAEGYYWLVIKNDVDDSGIISSEQEKLVKEPFFRLKVSDLSLSGIEKFGLGLGLTVVDHIIRSHNGKFEITTVKDHTTSKLKNCVMAKILLPIIK